MSPANANAVVPVDECGVELALKKLRRAMDNAGTFRSIRRHQYYVKPGERRRLKSHMARKQGRSGRWWWPPTTEPLAPGPSTPNTVSMAQRMQVFWHMIDPEELLGDHLPANGITSKSPGSPLGNLTRDLSEIPEGSAGEALFSERTGAAA